MSTKIPKLISLVVSFVIAFFVNIGWFFDPCARVVCPDAYGTYPLISYQPNFYIGLKCGGLTGKNCIPAHWSFSSLIFDIILFGILNLIVFFIIDKTFRKEKSGTA